jgi:cold shock CspA family protein
MERRIGVVRKWVEDRGFGFLKVLEKGDDRKPARIDSSLPDVFFHIKELKSAGIEKVDVGDDEPFRVVRYVELQRVLCGEEAGGLLKNDEDFGSILFGSDDDDSWPSTYSDPRHGLTSTPE